MLATEAPVTKPEPPVSWRAQPRSASQVRWRRRAPLVASVAYVAALAVWADGAREPRGFLVGTAAIGVAFAAARRSGHLERALGWGLALVLASLGAVSAQRGLNGCGEVGAMTCAAAAVMAIARIPPSAGIVPARALSPALSVVSVAVFWWAALVARFAPQTARFGWVSENPEAWEVGAVAASAVVMLAVTDWTLRRRRLELGVEERAEAIRAILAVCVATAVLVGFLEPTRAAPIGRAFVAAAATLVGAAALHPDAVTVTRLMRRVLVLASVGAGVVLLGASAGATILGDAWSATVVTALLALVVGTGAPIFDRLVRPGVGARLDAFARASVLASHGDPETALREALVALRSASGPASPSPELWILTPARVASVDAAGYLHEREGELPEALVRVATGEPEATLRANLVDSLEVRRPDLRPLSKWLSERGAWLATVIASEGEVEGALILPRVGRDRSPTLEEVRALKIVADRLAGPCRARALQTRMLARAQEMLVRAEAAEAKLDRQSRERALEAGREALTVARLARDVSVGVYAASSRMAVEALERRAVIGASIAVVAPSGVDPVPYLARAHLSGACRGGPLVVVDATSAPEHDVRRWRDACSSPLALAHRGMLVLLDGAGLPLEVQQLVARALGEGRGPWQNGEPLEVRLALTAVASPDELVARGRLDSLLASRLGDARSSPIVLPRLRDRPEDLRAIFNDRLAREGLRVHGRPVGIEHAAYARFVEYPFPGEDGELAVIIRRLVAQSTGDVVRLADVDFLVPSVRTETDAGIRRSNASEDKPTSGRSGHKARRAIGAGLTKGSGRDA